MALTFRPLAGPVHTPYDGSAQPFTIGLKPLDLRDWIEVDAALPDYLAQKERLHAADPGAVFAEEPDTRPAQREVLDLLRAHLPARYPDIYAMRGGRMTIAGAGTVLVEPAGDGPPLLVAARLVQEDLVLMRAGARGWRLAAASLCFPSSWSLAEKFGRPLHEIHAPVPAYGSGTRAAGVIQRIFDNMKPDQPVWRINWSIAAAPSLYLPLTEAQRLGRAAAPSRFAATDILAAAFIRIERQTLRRLPSSGDILFTIRIHVDPLAAIARHPERRRLAAALAGQIAALDAAQIDYKGLTGDRGTLIDALEGLASS